MEKSNNEICRGCKETALVSYQQLLDTAKII